MHGALQEELAAALLRSYAGRLATESGLASDRLASAGPQESTNTAYILRTLQARPCRVLAKPNSNAGDCRGTCAWTGWVPRNAVLCRFCCSCQTQEGANLFKSARMDFGVRGHFLSWLLLPRTVTGC